MSTQYYKLSGMCKWAKVRKPDPEYNNYTINVYLDEPSLQKFRESGMTMTPKADEDGEYITFRRPVEKLMKGEVVKFSAPPLFEADGKTEFEGLIGNGSNVEIKVTVFDTKKGRGHRLEGVRVLKLVEYNLPADVPITEGATPATTTTTPVKKALPF